MNEYSRMDPRRDRIRMNEEGDRLSSLPDDLIHKILSFMTIKEAIQTSALSSKWRFIWTSLPYLNFSCEDFHSLREFSEFVTHVLSGLNNEIEVSSLTLTFRGKASQVFVKKILNYAFSHNIQQLNVNYDSGKKNVFPLTLFRSQSLKHLTLNTGIHAYFCPLMLASSWELPSLTTLHIRGVRFGDEEYIGLFSKCVNLKNLTIKRCRVMGSYGLRICHPGLTNLTLKGYLAEFVNVVAPQLQNLCIRFSAEKHVISAPNLVSFCFQNGYPFHIISTDGFPILEKADLCISYPEEGGDANEMVCLLQQLHSVKFLTLNSEMVKVLSSSVELISHQPSPFLNLKSLNIYPGTINMNDKPQKKLDMSTEVKSYLLDGSLSATFTVVSCEEIIAVKNATSARNLMVKVRVLLDKGNASLEGHMTKMHEQTNAEIENESAQLKTKKLIRDFEGKMAAIESYWKDLRVKMHEWDSMTFDITDKLEEIDGLLTKLPTSHRDKMQPKFLSLSAEAHTITQNMMNCMKIQCAKKPNCFNVDFHELATSLQSSS